MKRLFPQAIRYSDIKELDPDSKSPAWDFLQYPPFSPDPELVLGLKATKSMTFGSVDLDVSVLYTGTNFLLPAQQVFLYRLTSQDPVQLGVSEFKTNVPYSWTVPITVTGYVVLFAAIDDGRGTAYSTLNFCRSNFVVVYNDGLEVPIT